MKRKSYTLMVLGALVGASVTGFLIVLLLGGTHRRARQGASANVETAHGRTARDRSEVARQEPKPVRIGRGSPSSLGDVRKKREPFDSPATREELARDSARVLEILDEIRAAETSKNRRDLYGELSKLIRGLGHRVTPRVREALLELLVDVEPQWRPLVGDTIGQLRGDTETASRLIDMLKAKPDSVKTRDAILTALGNMKVLDVVPELLDMIGSGSKMEIRVIKAVGRIGGDEAAMGLLGYLSRPLHAMTRIEIERALSQGRNPVALEEIRKALPKATDAESASYINVLGATRNDKYSDTVRNALANTKDTRTRKAAIRALGMFGDEKSGVMLLDLVQGGTKQDQIEATNAIHYIKDAATIGKLAERYDRLSDEARLAVLGAGARLQMPDKRLQDIAMKGLRSGQRRVRETSARLLGRRRNDAAVDSLVQMLRSSKSSSERTTALEALYRIGTRKSAEEALASLYVLPNEAQRQSYQKRFGKLRETSR